MTPERAAGCVSAAGMIGEVKGVAIGVVLAAQLALFAAGCGGSNVTLSAARVRWRAPDRVSPAQCQWLVISGAVWGGSCLRNNTLRSGLPEVVPLVLPIKGRSLPLLWGIAGANVARLNIIFQDGTHRNLPARGGIFLYPVPRSRWNKGHRPALLIARDKQNRVVSKRSLFRRTP
jgi:hypothetical protein